MSGCLCITGAPASLLPALRMHRTPGRCVFWEVSAAGCLDRRIQRPYRCGWREVCWSWPLETHSGWLATGWTTARPCNASLFSPVDSQSLVITKFPGRTAQGMILIQSTPTRQEASPLAPLQLLQCSSHHLSSAASPILDRRRNLAAEPHIVSRFWRAIDSLFPPLMTINPFLLSALLFKCCPRQCSSLFFKQ